jgi:Tfp pilus assembly protein PilO
MNKLSKDKRDKLILTIIAIIGVLGVLYTFILGAQKDSLYSLQTQIMGAKDKVSKAERLVKSEEFVQRNLAESQRQLEARTRDMTPPGKDYYWFFKMLDEFREHQDLNLGFIVEITQPEFIEVGLLPKFPFKAASFGVRLHGQYQEIGKFIADLENTYPYFRVQNVRVGTQGLNFAQMPPPGGSDGNEKLMVELRVVTLIKPGTT